MTKYDNERDEVVPDLQLYQLRPIFDQFGSMSSFSILLDRDLQHINVLVCHVFSIHTRYLQFDTAIVRV